MFRMEASNGLLCRQVHHLWVCIGRRRCSFFLNSSFTRLETFSANETVSSTTIRMESPLTTPGGARPVYRPVVADGFSSSGSELRCQYSVFRIQSGVPKQRSPALQHWSIPDFSVGRLETIAICEQRAGLQDL